MKLNSTVCIDAPTEKVWAALADIKNVDLWVEPIISVDCPGNGNKGVGAIRVCHLKGNMQIREQWTAWREGHSFTYEAEGAPLMKSAKNTWSIEPINGKTLLTSEAELTLKGGLFGKLLEPVMHLLFAKMGAQSLAGLKYLVETGRPYEGKFSQLPSPPMTC